MYRYVGYRCVTYSTWIEDRVSTCEHKLQYKILTQKWIKISYWEILEGTDYVMSQLIFNQTWWLLLIYSSVKPRASSKSCQFTCLRYDCTTVFWLNVFWKHVRKVFALFDAFYHISALCRKLKKLHSPARQCLMMVNVPNVLTVTFWLVRINTCVTKNNG